MKRTSQLFPFKSIFMPYQNLIQTTLFLSSISAFKSRFFTIFKLSDANFSFQVKKDALLKVYPSSHTQNQCYPYVSSAFFKPCIVFTKTFSNQFFISLSFNCHLDKFVNCSTSNLDFYRDFHSSQ